MTGQNLVANNNRTKTRNKPNSLPSQRPPWTIPTMTFNRTREVLPELPTDSVMNHSIIGVDSITGRVWSRHHPTAIGFRDLGTIKDPVQNLQGFNGLTFIKGSPLLRGCPKFKTPTCKICTFPFQYRIDVRRKITLSWILKHQLVPVNIMKRMLQDMSSKVSPKTSTETRKRLHCVLRRRLQTAGMFDVLMQSFEVVDSI